MKNDSLLEELNKYLSDSECEGAFYIDGKWGTGKTYYVKQRFKNELEQDDKKVLMVSLSGMRSLDEINEELFSQLHPKLSAIKNSRATRGIVYTVLAAAGTFNVDSDNAYKALKTFLKPSEVNDKVIILDDFERCRIDLQELFSYINNLISENKVKVILIGNDEEVIRYLQSLDLYRNNLIAAILARNPEGYMKNKKEISEPLLYDLIKEKSISKQYDFIFDNEIFFELIAKNYIEKVQAILERNKDDLTNIMSRYGCSNLRTCKYVVEIFIEIMTKLEKLYQSVNDGLLDNIIKCCFTYGIKFKNGKKIEAMNDLIFEDYTLFRMESVKNYIEKLIWNEGKIKDECDSILISLDDSNVPEYLARLNTYWLLQYENDKDLEKDINQLKDDIYKDLLNYKYYYSAFKHFYNFINLYGFQYPHTIEEITDIMVANIEKHDIGKNYSDNNIYDFPEEASKLLQKLDSAFSNKKFQNSSTVLNSLMLKMTAESAHEINNMTDSIISNRCFFSVINIDDLHDRVVKAKPIEIIYLTRSISYVYSFSNIEDFFKEDKENITIFLELLEQDEYPNNKLKQQANEMLKRDLKEYLRRFEYHNIN